MKKIFFSLAIATMFMAGTVFTSCQSSDQKDGDENAMLNKTEHDMQVMQNDDSDTPKMATADEWETFKLESELQINNNKIRIKELKEKIKKTGVILDSDYTKKIENLEKKNKDLKTKLEKYDKEQSDWGKFKREFKHDMDELGKAFKDV
ncbi:MAG: hypothetical protein C0595_11920 [Marinilabiliales bacterium]|nr:MAG: hypothetical protein C0595_11920 [Marinilabiliales bacterium]